jgi:hypothetical protein
MDRSHHPGSCCRQPPPHDPVACLREKIHWDEEQDTVTWKSCTSGYFRGREKHFSALDFIAQLTLHILARGRHLVRRYELYSSRGRGTLKDRLALRARAPKQESLDTAACLGARRA